MNQLQSVFTAARAVLLVRVDKVDANNGTAGFAFIRPLLGARSAPKPVLTVSVPQNASARLVAGGHVVGFFDDEWELQALALPQHVRAATEAELHEELLEIFPLRPSSLAEPSFSFLSLDEIQQFSADELEVGIELDVRLQQSGVGPRKQHRRRSSTGPAQRIFFRLNLFQLPTDIPLSSVEFNGMTTIPAGTTAGTAHVTSTANSLTLTYTVDDEVVTIVAEAEDGRPRQVAGWGKILSFAARGMLTPRGGEEEGKEESPQEISRISRAVAEHCIDEVLKRAVATATGAGAEAGGASGSGVDQSATGDHEAPPPAETKAGELTVLSPQHGSTVTDSASPVANEVNEEEEEEEEDSDSDDDDITPERVVLDVDDFVEEISETLDSNQEEIATMLQRAGASEGSTSSIQLKFKAMERVITSKATRLLKRFNAALKSAIARAGASDEYYDEDGLSLSELKEEVGLLTEEKKRLSRKVEEGQVIIYSLQKQLLQELQKKQVDLDAATRGGADIEAVKEAAEEQSGSSKRSEEEDDFGSYDESHWKNQLRTYRKRAMTAETRQKTAEQEKEEIAGQVEEWRDHAAERVAELKHELEEEQAKRMELELRVERLRSRLQQAWSLSGGPGTPSVPSMNTDTRPRMVSMSASMRRLPTKRTAQSAPSPAAFPTAGRSRRTMSIAIARKSDWEPPSWAHRPPKAREDEEEDYTSGEASDTGSEGDVEDDFEAAALEALEEYSGSGLDEGEEGSDDDLDEAQGMVITATIPKEGFLRKRGHRVKNWKTRWVNIEDDGRVV